MLIKLDREMFDTVRVQLSQGPGVLESIPSTGRWSPGVHSLQGERSQ